VIDKGKSDGVQENSAVVSSQGVVVGKVINVKEKSALVYLLNHPECKLAASIMERDNTSGIAEGELGLSTTMKFIPQSEPIRVGDTVVTSGLEESIPRGLVIGQVSQINKENNELWQQAVIESPINFDELLVVAAIII
jgi:rod shape-determining protein MreC